MDNAMQFVPEPLPSDEQIAEWTMSSIKEALSYGLTSVHDAMTANYTLEHFKR